MHWKHLRAVMLAVVGIVLVAMAPASAEPGDIIEIGPGAYPQWSPDGEYLAFVHGGYLMVAPVSGKGNRTQVAQFRAGEFVWASGEEIVYVERFNQPDKLEFKSVLIQYPEAESGESGLKISAPSVLATTDFELGNYERVARPIRLVDGTIGYLVVKSSIFDRARFVPLKEGTQLTEREKLWPHVISRVEGKPLSQGWGDLWLSRFGLPRSEERRVTTNKKYGLATVSPSGEKFVAKERGGAAYDVFDTTGHRITRITQSVGDDPETPNVEGSSYVRWSPDGTRISFIRSTDDGHVVLGTSLMVGDLKTGHVTEMLDSTYDLAGDHSWSPNGDAIAVVVANRGIVIVEVGL